MQNLDLLLRVLSTPAIHIPIFNLWLLTAVAFSSQLRTLRLTVVAAKASDSLCKIVVEEGCVSRSSQSFFWTQTIVWLGQIIRNLYFVYCSISTYSSGWVTRDYGWRDRYLFILSKAAWHFENLFSSQSIWDTFCELFTKYSALIHLENSL